jgi:hypothetical protein
MFERHKRENIEELNRPCELDFRRRLNAAITAANRASEALQKARGHNYDNVLGELYRYSSGAYPGGVLVLRVGGGRVIFTGALLLNGLYRLQSNQFFDCSLAGTDCVLYAGGDLMPLGRPSGLNAEIVTDARNGRLRPFSNASKFLALTPW